MEPYGNLNLRQNFEMTWGCRPKVSPRAALASPAANKVKWLRKKLNLKSLFRAQHAEIKKNPFPHLIQELKQRNEKNRTDTYC